MEAKLKAIMEKMEANGNRYIDCKKKTHEINTVRICW